MCYDLNIKKGNFEILDLLFQEIDVYSKHCKVYFPIRKFSSKVPDVKLSIVKTL